MKQLRLCLESPLQIVYRLHMIRKQQGGAILRALNERRQEPGGNAGAAHTITVSDECQE